MKTTTDQLKALGDETRLRILALLAERELCVCEILAVLELPQSTVSRHLAILRRAGWVLDRRQGSWMYYRLVVDEPFHGPLLATLLRRLAATGQGEFDRQALARFVAGEAPAACRN